MTDTTKDDIITPIVQEDKTELPTSSPPDLPGINNPASVAMVTAVKGYVTNWLGARTKHFRPMGSFCNKERLSCPRPKEVITRVRTNLIFYQSNYLLVFFFLAIYSALSSPMFLIATVGIILAWLYVFKWRKHPVKVGAYELPNNAKAIALFFFTAVVCYFASVGTVIFWLFMATSVVVFLHALFYTPEEIDPYGFGLPEQMPGTTGFPQTI